MIILSNSIAQTLNPGQSATFDTIVLHTGEAECFRPNSGAIRTRFKNAIYEINIGANIGSTTVGEAQIAVAFDGSPMLETTMISQTNAVGDLNHVSCETAIRNFCCAPGAITIVNTGTTVVTIGANPVLKVKRTA